MIESGPNVELNPEATKSNSAQTARAALELPSFQAALEASELEGEPTITVLDNADQAAVARARRSLGVFFDRAVGDDMADDRFQPPDVVPGDYVGLLATVDGILSVAVSATAGRGRLQLDVIGDPTLGPERLLDLAAGSVAKVIAEYVDRHGEPGQELTLELWGRPQQSWHDELAARFGMVHHRSLFQMRGPLPVTAPIESLATRPYHAESDRETVLEINNRAFASHPDQSAVTLEDFTAQTTTSWFDPRGLLIHEVDGQAAGFCWTKIHAPHRGRPALGEIYVIAIDPSFHGLGLGTRITAAGLAWLHDQGLDTAMLYVESDNLPALGAYRKLGFTTHRTDTAWRLPANDLEVGQ